MFPPPRIPYQRITVLRLVLLLITGILTPLILPREYVPVDPKVRFTFFILTLYADVVAQHPSTPSPELTSSWLSWGTFSFVDPILLRAYRASGNFKMDDLPPLADVDKSRYLKKIGFPVCSDACIRDVLPQLSNMSCSISILCS